MQNYSDLNTLIGETDSRDVLSGNAAIVNGMANVLLISKRSRKFMAPYGSSAHEFLHKPVSVQNASLLQTILYQALRKWCSTISTVNIADIVVQVMANRAGYLLYIYYKSALDGSTSRVNFALPTNTRAGKS